MPHRQKLWPWLTIRAFAILNMVIGGLGFVALSATVATTFRYHPWPQTPPLYAQTFYFRSAINLAFVILTILAGTNLWRVNRRGWSLSKLVFGGEIVYLLLQFLNFSLFPLYGPKALAVYKALAATAGTGNMGTTLQTVTGYPIVALIALKIAYRKLEQNGAQSPTIAPAPSD